MFAGGFVNRLHGGHARGGAGVLVISALSSAGFLLSCPPRTIEIAHRNPKHAPGAGLPRRRGTQIPHRADVRDSLAELGRTGHHRRRRGRWRRHPKNGIAVAATFIGKGKAEEFAEFCKANDVDTVIFDDELSPAQSRNLEKIFDCKILDRTALILDIFAPARPHARRQVADRTGAAAAFAAAPDAVLGPLVAPIRRHRHARRRRRIAA